MLLREILRTYDGLEASPSLQSITLTNARMGNTRWGLKMKTPKTQDQWEESIAEHKKGVIILERRMYNSAAFRELSEHPKHLLVLLVALNQVFWEKKKNSKRGKRIMANGGRVYLPQNALKATGIKSNGTIAEAKKRLVELGFLDVLETGSVNNAAVFQISYRWRQYPNGDYMPKDKKELYVVRRNGNFEGRN